MNAGKGIIHVLYIRDEGSYDSGQNIGFLRGISFWETEEQVQSVAPEPQRVIDAEAEAGTFMDDSDVDDDF